MTVTLEEAQAKLSELIHGWVSGEELHITDGGVVVATLVPVPLPPPPLRSSRRGNSAFSAGRCYRWSTSTTRCRGEWNEPRPPGSGALPATHFPP